MIVSLFFKIRVSGSNFILFYIRLRVVSAVSMDVSVFLVQFPFQQCVSFPTGLTIILTFLTNTSPRNLCAFSKKKVIKKVIITFLLFPQNLSDSVLICYIDNNHSSYYISFRSVPYVGVVVSK